MPANVVCASFAVGAPSANQMANAQVRASKLSFADVVKRLAAQNPALPTFIAKQVSYTSAWFSNACILDMTVHTRNSIVLYQQPGVQRLPALIPANCICCLGSQAYLAYENAVLALDSTGARAHVLLTVQEATVERFVVVHGQIILNQFRAYPNKAIAASAFATALKALMESRRHSKLYMGSVKGKRPTIGNRNPMKVLLLPTS